ncbi:hypothetical protein GQX74_003410 [Glossina fuscipes]|nr:hypothetical protein GQX74_003410 [Glossina fuscipes]
MVLLSLTLLTSLAPIFTALVVENNKQHFSNFNKLHLVDLIYRKVFQGTLQRFRGLYDCQARDDIYTNSLFHIQDASKFTQYSSFAPLTRNNSYWVTVGSGAVLGGN